MNAAFAAIIHTHLSSCYFTVWGWCPVETILGTLALSAVWIWIVIGFRLLKYHFSKK